MPQPRISPQILQAVLAMLAQRQAPRNAFAQAFRVTPQTPPIMSDPRTARMPSPVPARAYPPVSMPAGRPGSVNAFADWLGTNAGPRPQMLSALPRMR